MINEDNTNKHFKGQLETEVVQCFYRKHWIVLIKDFIGFFLFVAILSFTTFHFKGIHTFFSQDSFFITFLAFSVVGLFTLYIHKFFLGIIRYFLDIVIITNYRIVKLDKSLFLRDGKDATDLAKIQDIQKSQNGIIKNLLRFGEIVITLSSTATTKVLTAVPNPDYHFRKLNKLKREYIKERAGHKKIKKPELGTQTKAQPWETALPPSGPISEQITEETVSGLS